jgi:Fe-S-cluster containining protein
MVFLQELPVPIQKTREKSGSAALCEECSGLCCRYLALQIDTPKDWDDYDDIRWYLSHKGVSVFVEKGDWYLQMNSRCRYLDKEYRCRNYELRPKICRTYHTKDCEKTSDEYGYELHFLNDKQMADYMKERFGERVFERLEKKRKSKAVRRKGRS